MKLSVIVPVYNAERYLRECLDSIKAQTFTDFEVICVDDGSTDASAAILDEYVKMDVRIRVIHRCNGGASVARNVALGIAKGEWVAFVDSDDTIKAEWFAHAMQIAAVENPDLIRLASMVDGTSMIVESYNGRDAIEWGWRILFEAGYICFCFIKRNVIGENRFRIDVRCKEDGLFLMELIPRLQKICNSYDNGYYYRPVQGSLTNGRRTVAHCCAYLNACLDLWIQQSGWLREMGLDELVRKRLRQGADHDVWEWNHLRDPADCTNPDNIFFAYRRLEKSGALWPAWCYRKTRLRLPFELWRKTGSWAGLQVLEWLENIYRRIRFIGR